MKKLLFTIYGLLLSLVFYGQADSIYFSNAIKIDFEKYKVQSEFAYRTGDVERGEFLFDSLVDNRLRNTIFDNFSVKKNKGGKFRFEKTKKPVVLITYASWCVFSQGEIAAINKLARKFNHDVDFVVLFWDRKSSIKKVARKFNHHINVCYAHEYYRTDAHIVASLKHTLGFPTCFYIDSNKRVADIRRSGIYLPDGKKAYKKCYALNYNAFLDGLATIIMDRELKEERLAVN